MDDINWSHINAHRKKKVIIHRDKIPKKSGALDKFIKPIVKSNGQRNDDSIHEIGTYSASKVD